MNSSPRLLIMFALLIGLLVPSIASADPFLYTLSVDFTGLDGLPAGSTVNWEFEAPSFLTAPTTITNFMSASLGSGLSGCVGVLDAQVSPFFAPTPYSSFVTTGFIGSCNGINNLTEFSFGELNPGVHTARDVSGQIVGTLTVAAVPEPSSLILFGTGVLGLVGVIRRKLRA